MCGRFHVGEELIRRLENHFPNLSGKPAAGDVYPSREAAILFLSDGRGGTAKTVSARLMRWGYEMAPHTRLLINARAETIDSRPAFREDYALRRCVIPASGFYEWKRTGRESVKYEFTDPGEILFLAGIFRPEGDSGRFVVITTAANRSMIPVHDRMPVLMGAEEIGGWLRDPEVSRAILGRQPMELKAELAEDAWEQLSLFDMQR